MEKIKWKYNSKTRQYYNSEEIGDEIMYKECCPLIPNGSHEWLGVVTKIESNYYEAEYHRCPNAEWLKLLVSKLATNHRTYLKQTVRVYAKTSQLI